ncbi:MAG: hypothetical protein ACJAQT_003833 [Akkermansiaceae bacterium]
MPPGFFFGGGGGVVELLFDIEDGEEGVLKICAGEGWSEELRGVGLIERVGHPGIVAEGGPDDGGVDLSLLVEAEGKGAGQFFEAGIGVFGSRPLLSSG